MSKDHDCKICGRSFERARRRNEHQKTCGISQLDDYGIETKALDKVERHQFKDRTDDSRQIDLETDVIGDCVKCGATITSEHSYNGLKNYVECPECEKVHNKEMMRNEE